MGVICPFSLGDCPYSYNRDDYACYGNESDCPAYEDQSNEWDFDSHYVPDDDY